MDLLKQLDCHLAGLLETANGHTLQHACSSELDEEFLCCCERARHAIKDFTHQGHDGKVSDCFPVALDALRDLEWCLGKILRHGYEGYEIETDLYIRLEHEIETNLKEFSCQLEEFLRFAQHNSDKKIELCCERALRAIKDFTYQGLADDGRVSDCFPVALSALRELQDLQFSEDLCFIVRERIENTKYVFFKRLADAIKTLKYPSKRLAFFVEQADEVKIQNQIESTKHYRSLLPRFFKRLVDIIQTTQYQSVWLTFFEEQADQIKRQADGIYPRKYKSMLRRFRKIEMYHIRKGRDPILLHKIERALHSLELPETSINKQGPSVMSFCWDARNGRGSAHQLPPGLNVDDLGEIYHLRDLGGGWQGMVYKAVWGPRGADLPLTDDLGDSESDRVYEAWGRLVAVKEVRSETRSEGLEALEAVVRISGGGDSVSRSNLDCELDVLKTLNHPNIVELNGYTRKTRAEGKYGLVMELMECSLEDFIESEELSELEKVDTLLQVARGMHFLHREVGIMHRDLKPGNILIKRLTCLPADARRLGYVVAKLADFGLSKGLYSEHEDLATADGAGCHTYKRGTSFYMAPEVRLKSPDDPSESHYSQSADVFSFGTTCFNVLTGEDTPFTQEGRPLTPSEFYRRIEQRDLDPFVIQYRQSKMTALVTKCLCLDPFVIQCRQSKMEALVTKCWSFDPANRPDFFEICQILEEEKRRILCLSTSTSQVSPPL